MRETVWGQFQKSGNSSRARVPGEPAPAEDRDRSPSGVSRGETRTENRNLPSALLPLGSTVQIMVCVCIRLFLLRQTPHSKSASHHATSTARKATADRGQGSVALKRHDWEVILQ